MQFFAICWPPSDRNKSFHEPKEVLIGHYSPKPILIAERLVCGLKNIQIQKKLLPVRELTFKKAFETAQSMELANKEDIRDVITTGDESVNKVD